jgi:hypothetical protein
MRFPARPFALLFAALAAFALCHWPARSLAAEAAWTFVPPPANDPPAILQAAMVLDEAHRRILLYGGADPPYDLWSMTLDGPTTWAHLVPPATLPPRHDAPGAVFDAAANRMVVYGGPSSDTTVYALSLNGSMSWGALPTVGPGPGPRTESFIVFDAARRRLLVFGGYAGSVLSNELWALDLHDPPTWTKVVYPAGPAPSPRSGCMGVVDPSRDRLVLYGGFAGYSTLDTWPVATWALPLDGSAGWQTLESLGPGGTANQGRERHSAIYDPAGDRMIVHGGSGASSAPKSETWSFNFSSNSWSQITAAGAPAMVSHSATYDPDLQRMLAFSAGEAWSLSLGITPSWTRLSPPANPVLPRSTSLSVFVPDSNAVYVLSPSGSSQASPMDVWKFHPRPTPSWKRVVTSVGPPSFQQPTVNGTWQLVHDSSRNQLVVVGGVLNHTATTVYTLRLSDGRWTKLAPTGTPPETRMGASMIYDSARDRVLTFSGEVSDPEEGHTVDGVWELILGTAPAWTLLNPLGTPPISRSYATSFYDSARDRMVVVAGVHKYLFTWNNLDDAWSLDFGTQTWAQLPIAPPTPGPQYLQAGAYDPARDHLVLLSSNTAGAPPFAYNPVWALSFANLTWSPITVAGDPPNFRYLAAAAWDAPGDQLVLFGGTGAMSFDETWELGFSGVTSAPGPSVRANPALALGAARPNPASNAITFAAQLPDDGAARLELWDVAGRRQLSRDLRGLGSGTHLVRLDVPGSLAAGIYWARLVHATGVRTARVVIAR